MLRALAASALALALLAGTAGTARADVPPPNSTECGGKDSGAACLDDASRPGVCTASMCSKLDYSDGSPPGSVQYACTLCIATDGGAGAGTSSGATTSGGGKCAMGAMGQGPAEGASWLMAAALALPWLRRRRSR